MTKSSYDKLMQVNSEKFRLKENKNYKLCDNKDSDCCVLWYACNSCYYYISSQLVCPFCDRIMPNEAFLNKDGKTCKWCKNE